jgi:phospholipid transport system substrate-binding protein
MADQHNASNPVRQKPLRIWWPVILMISLFPFAGVTAELLPPQKVIKDTSERMIRVLEQDREKLLEDPEHVYRLANDILIPHVDMYRVSRLVLGKYWRRASREQRLRFSEEFRRMLVRTYASALKQFRGQADIRFQPMHIQQGDHDVAVNTRIARASAQPVSVSYRLHLKKGQWLAYDVKIEGVSLVTNYRSSFARQIRQKGLDALIRRIRELNERRTQRPEPVVADNEGL